MESGDWIGLLALVVALVSFGVNAYFTRQERRARTTCAVPLHYAEELDLARTRG